MTSAHHHQLPGFFSKLISESPCIGKTIGENYIVDQISVLWCYSVLDVPRLGNIQKVFCSVKPLNQFVLGLHKGTYPFAHCLKNFSCLQDFFTNTFITAQTLKKAKFH
jgi:hypothetical protein